MNLSWLNEAPTMSDLMGIFHAVLIRKNNILCHCSKMKNEHRVGIVT